MPTGEPEVASLTSHLAAVGATAEAGRDVERRAAEAAVLERTASPGVDPDADAKGEIVVHLPPPRRRAPGGRRSSESPAVPT